MTCSSCAGGLANRLCGLGWVTSILIVAGQDAADGTPFGRYRLIELLGRGGMGEVWRAFDTDTDRIVALKVLPPHLSEGVDFQRRFRREAHAAARLNNPHVIPIHHYGEIDGRLYVDMRLIDGRDLHSVLADGPLAPARAVRIIEQVAKALHAAHKVGLVHRDVKPSNILLDEDDFAYLIDFGIARAAGETSLTATGGFIGSWPYMAPERFGPQEVDARADVYALACVLYQCLTGHTPYPGNSLEQQYAGHVATPPPEPSRANPNVPAGFDRVTAKGLAKDRNQRYGTTVELARAALAATTDPIPRQPSTDQALPPTQPASDFELPPTIPVEVETQKLPDAEDSKSIRKPPKLRWSRTKWLHRPTQEVVDNDDPRVPRTVDDKKKRRREWLEIDGRGDAKDGYYRMDMDMDMATARAAEPTYAATWHPNHGPVEELLRGTGSQAYWACVRHNQAK